MGEIISGLGDGTGEGLALTIRGVGVEAWTAGGTEIGSGCPVQALKERIKTNKKIA
ncbi:MAG TPA: hypothetical protein VF707_10055 [Ardenticatenaceae bacterium]